MNRQEKQSVIDAIKDDFQRSKASFIIATKGMDVSMVQKLRSQLYEKKGSMRVVKNTLLKRATSDLEGFNELGPFFSDQIAIVFAGEEVSSIAKVLYETTKKVEHLTVKAGTLDDRLISVEQFILLAKLPSKEVLLAQLCGTLKAPITNYVMLLNQLIVRFLLVLKEIEKKRNVNV